MNGLVEHKQCPQCAEEGRDNQSDNLAVYDDGVYCFSCGYTTRKEGATSATSFHHGSIKALTERKLDIQSLGKYQVQCIEQFTGHLGKTYVYQEPCIVFNFYEKGKVVKQKIRSLSDRSKCTQLGNTKSKALFGMQAFTPSKRIPVIITEGEFDAVAVHQAINYPTVSIGGAGNAAKYISENIEWLSGFAHVVLCFDSDEAGQGAVDAAIGLFEVGKVRVAHLPLKDANDMLMANREEELKRCIWNAEIMKPSTIVGICDLMDEALERPLRGTEWSFKNMDKVTYGMRPGTMYTLAAAEAVGKTLFLHELIFGMMENDVKVGLFSFEQSAGSTVQRMVGTKLNKKLHLPDKDMNWDEKEIRAAMDDLDGKLFMYNNKGALSLESVILNIRYLVKCMGVKLIVIDNLTALSSVSMSEGKYISELNYMIQSAGAFKSLCNELDICIVLVAHVNNDTISKSMHVSTKQKEDSFMDLSADEFNTKLSPAGSEWSSGRIPSERNIYCGGALRKLSDYVIVLARNRESEDLREKNTTKVKFLKCRLDGEFDGYSFNLEYNTATGRLEEDTSIVNKKPKTETKTDVNSII